MTETEPTTAMVQYEQRRTISFSQGEMEFSVEDRRIIRASICPQANEVEFAALMKVASLKRLNPLTGQIHFVKRKQRVDGQYIERWTTQTGIDGFRAIAERTGRYDGQDEPEFEYDKDGRLLKCRVRVFRKDVQRPFVGVSFFREYAQYTNDGRLTKMWDDKPHVMLAKCTEAQALRKAFPEDLDGLNTPEELGEDVGPAPTPAKPALDADFSTSAKPAALPPAAAAGKESDEQKADRLVAICTAEAKTPAQLTDKLSKLKTVQQEGGAMARGPHRDRVLSAYSSANEQLKAALRALKESGQQPANDDTGPCAVCDREGKRFGARGYRCAQHEQDEPRVEREPGADG